MKLNKQSCPYCHSEKPILRASNDKIQMYIANSLKNQPLTVVYDFASEVGPNEECVFAPCGAWQRAISYCPMCGRSLAEHHNDATAYIEEQSKRYRGY